MKKISFYLLIVITAFITYLFIKGIPEEMPATEYGRIGRDTALFFQNGKYQIMHVFDYCDLTINYKNGTCDTILKNVSKYKVESGTLYVISMEGYAVIDGESENARVFVTVREEDFDYGHTYINGCICFHSGHIDDEHISYLSDYDEFSDKEKETFEKMLQ